MPKYNNNVPKLDIKPEMLDELLKGSKVRARSTHC